MKEAPIVRRHPWRSSAVLVLSILPLLSILLTTPAAQPAAGHLALSVLPVNFDLGRPLDWPLPSRVPLTSYEARLFAFLNARGYASLGWRQDKGVRDTGPYADGKSFGTHPAVRVFYSPGVVRWLLGGRVGASPTAR